MSFDVPGNIVLFILPGPKIYRYFENIRVKIISSAEVQLKT